MAMQRPVIGIAHALPPAPRRRGTGRLDPHKSRCPFPRVRNASVSLPPTPDQPAHDSEPHTGGLSLAPHTRPPGDRPLLKPSRTIFPLRTPQRVCTSSQRTRKASHPLDFDFDVQEMGGSSTPTIRSMPLSGPPEVWDVIHAPASVGPFHMAQCGRYSVIVWQLVQSSGVRLAVRWFSGRPSRLPCSTASRMA